MNKRITVTDPPRNIPSGLQASLPLVTLAWRTLRAEHQRRETIAQIRDEQDSRLLEALGEVAEQNWRLQRSIQVAASASDGGRGEELCGAPLAISQGIEQILNSVGLSVLAPEGEPYAGELVHMFDNVAQRPDATASQAELAEVLSPAILCHDELLRMGKAVITVPTLAPPS